MKKLIAALLAFAMLFSLCACGGTNDDNKTNDETRVVTDACGREVTIPGTVKSVICVGVGSLRFTTYMDALDLLVGVEENELGVRSEALCVPAPGCVGEAAPDRQQRRDL